MTTWLEKIEKIEKIEGNINSRILMTDPKSRKELARTKGHPHFLFPKIQGPLLWNNTRVPPRSAGGPRPDDRYAPEALPASRDQEAPPKTSPEREKLALAERRPLPDIDGESLNGLRCLAAANRTLDGRFSTLMTYLLTATCAFIRILLPGVMGRSGGEERFRFRSGMGAVNL